MSMTRAELMDASRDIADAAGSPRWSDAMVRTWLGMVHWQEFKNILNANNEYTLESITVTEDVNGQFPLSDLITGTGDTTKTYYRIQAMAQSMSGPGSGAGPYWYYKQVLFRDYPVPQQTAQMPYVWYQFGDRIQVLPVQQATQLTVSVNQLPQRADLLASDASIVVFPAGYEMLLAYMTASNMLMKGAAQADAAQAMQVQADAIREPMMQDLRRLSIWPTRARALDSADQWGGG